LKQLDKLDPNDWEHSVLLLRQIQSSLQGYQDSPVAKEINQLSSRLTSGIDKVYQNLGDIQQNMNDLRGRQAIRNSTPGTSSTPTDDLLALEQVLLKLYQNPFDEKSQYYAQKMHARLDDRLRYIERPEDTEMNEWVKQDIPRDYPVDSTENERIIRKTITSSRNKNS